ncbi:AGC/RSK/RSKP70 protein kinase [Spizellomyces punctatus DAOM BR117]|uniref:non-specific serine/threonine protein kinase n=1 Tax=Spizellomyces punctatus (strain DAOM BR117) TaxID=645134 RepID=A0A0L0HQ72_SPIPD|nr:AGC/RSK/RSKP70 protein kinase [Spizellomyces punctatus DAOM BR117]XP_016611143.1 AGC/RSK/RSKP70 protein kinase [Spizellomyces punctatus DAOM BR117]KND03090.1 AGC/RSK/RSKP70 protein kinase [Spizellomyces punctatus DAOM BR117]KND03104.1 AGC/RSK/RSKP70 protein kinase [Spizellomyces punctatus DAOM BR117]|eukprot:XP_016611129.1 AGC/RSK/RSKP70 protein kinase [Spizellomyces punctatus DAOM BR117]
MPAGRTPRESMSATEDEDDDHVFAFDKDETFRRKGPCNDSACEDLSGIDSDASSSTVRWRPPVPNGQSNLNPAVRKKSTTIAETPSSILPSSPSEEDTASTLEPRLSFAEPADVSQVVDIHNFTAITSADTPNSVYRRKVGLSDFDVVSVIGKGAYGKVFLVRKKGGLHATQGKSDLYAMKVLRKASIVLHGKDAEHTRNERNILEEVQHPFIVTLHYAFQTEFKLYLILSYASGGELFTYLAHEKMFAEDVACFYIAELLLAIEHLHELGIIYRDLKPENVLLNSTGHVLLTDFGLSKVALDARTVCGTIEFMAPEVLDEHRQEGYDKAVDYWSLGVMLYDMLTGSVPWKGNRKQIMDGILKKKVTCPKYMTAHARDLCTKLLQKNPGKRLGSGPKGPAQAKEHLFFRRNKLDWQKLAKLEVAPPLVPKMLDPEDTSNFDECFTKMPVADSPSEAAFDHFAGFSYVAESAYLG